MNKQGATARASANGTSSSCLQGVRTWKNMMQGRGGRSVRERVYTPIILGCQSDQWDVGRVSTRWNPPHLTMGVVAVSVCESLPTKGKDFIFLLSAQKPRNKSKIGSGE